MSAGTAVKTVAAFAFFVALAIAGGLLARVLGWPIPGPVIGLIALAGVLISLGHVPDSIARVADFLVAHLNLFYIPAGVAVMGFVGLVAKDAWPILAALFVSTLGGLAVGAYVFRLVVGPEKE